MYTAFVICIYIYDYIQLPLPPTILDPYIKLVAALFLKIKWICTRARVLYRLDVFLL